jgi:MFS family permease
MTKKIPRKRKPALVANGSTYILRLAVLTFAAIVLGLCIFALPAGMVSDETGMYRWILAGMYLPAIPFFFAIYQTMKLLGYIDKNTAFSDASVAALRVIKNCGLIITGLFTAGLPYIFYVANKDDAPGVLALALVIIIASAAVSVFAAVLQRLLQNAIAIKTENDLTV